MSQVSDKTPMGLKTTGDKLGSRIARIIDSQKVALWTASISAVGLNGYQLFLPKDEYKKEWWWWTIAGFLFLCLILGIYFSFKNAQDIEKLKEENNQLERDLQKAIQDISTKNRIVTDIQIAHENQMLQQKSKREDLSDDILRSLFKSCGFDVNERISIYSHIQLGVDQDERFVLIGRFAQNKTLGKPNPKTSFYPNKENTVIGKGWVLSGNFFVDNLPDPKTAEREYKKRLKELDILVEEAHYQAIRMKSRTYLAFAIKVRDVNSAVIVFESIAAEAFKAEVIIAIFENFSPLAQSLIIQYEQPTDDAVSRQLND